MAKKQSKLIKNEENHPKPKPFDEYSGIWYVDVFQQKKMLQKNCFSILAFFGLFFYQKTAKLTKNEENCQNPNRLIKFSEIWYVYASQQRKCYNKYFFGFWPVLAVFLTKKQPKLTKNEENWQNPNHLMKFS